MTYLARACAEQCWLRQAKQFPRHAFCGLFLTLHTYCTLCLLLCSKRTKQHASPPEIQAVRLACKNLLADDFEAGACVPLGLFGCPAL